MGEGDRFAAIMSLLDAIHNQDCIAGMKRLKAGTVDLAFADPPFNIGYDYDVYKDRLEAEKYLDWCRQWTAEVVRVLKPEGTFWLAIGDEYAAELKIMLQQEHGLGCRSWVVWYYTFGVNCKQKFSRSHAHLFYMVKDQEHYTFNFDTIRVPSARQLVYGDRRATPRAACPTTPGFFVPRTWQTVSGRGKHLVLSSRLRHVQGAGRLARLSDAGAIARANHTRQQQRGRSGARSLRRQRHNAGGGEEASAGNSWASSLPRNMPNISRSD